MIDAVIRASLQHRALVLVAGALVLVGGAYQAAIMPVDVFPDLTAPTVTIVADAHGMAPEEVESLLTFPLETALNGAAGVRRVRSTTQVGVAVVSVDFDWDTDIYRARQIVSERLQLLSTTLPPDVEQPVMGPITSIMGEILFVGLGSDTHSRMDLRTTADWTIVRRLLAVPGVAQVIPIGGDVRQFQVQLDPKRLDAYEVTADDVAHALEDSNENTSAGFLVEGGQEHLIHGVGRVRNVEDIAASLVTMRGDLPVLVGQLGKVVVGAALKRGDGGVNGREGVVIGIRKQPTADTLTLTAEITELLGELEKSFPEGMWLEPALFRQSDFIDVAVDNVAEALRDGAILVVLIVLLFLGSGRATFITALAIPLSLLAGVLAMAFQGIHINTMTLGGMAIAVGALVDDAIIDVENVARRLRQEQDLPLEQRRPVIEVVFAASKEIRRSIVFATLIIVLVFLPLFFLTSVEGRLLHPLGFAYSVALFASLLVALTITPALCSLLLPGMRRATSEHTWVVRGLIRAYAPVLTAVVRRWRLLTVLSLLGLVGAGVALARAGVAFLPAFNEGALTVGAVTPPGTALGESAAIGRLVEQTLLAHPEVVSTARRTGRAERDEHAQAANATEVEVRLRRTERGEPAFLAEVRAQLSQLPGTSITIGQPIAHRIDHMLSGARANIAVKIFGPELAELRRLAAEVEGVMSGIPGVADLSAEAHAEVPFVRVRFNRRTIARYGLTVEQVSHEIETAFQGRTVSRVLEGRHAFDLVVRYDAAKIDSLEAVAETRIGTPTGARVPLHVLADVQRDIGPNVIQRENAERRIIVMCNVVGRDLQAVVGEIRARITAEVARSEGYRIEYGGQFERAESAARTLAAVGLAVLVGIFVLLVVALGGPRDALLVMANLPLALIGGVGGVYLAGGVLSVASIIGFITLFGIATRNGIMLVTHFQYLVDTEGITDRFEVVRRGAIERLSPILMTALASGLGLLPLALSLGEPGSEIQAPMALVILSGLVTATALNMVVLPALYLRFGAATR
jgi:CzcA family heavy metal efflux pump